MRAYNVCDMVQPAPKHRFLIMEKKHIMNTVAEKLTALRAQMRAQQFDAWIAPTADPHLSEYLPEHWQSRVWLSGFTGSAGTLVLTQDKAILWADSRYWEQAAVQLAGTEITLGKLGTEGNHTQWLVQQLPTGARVGVASDMLSLAEKRTLQAAFAAKNITLHHQHDCVADIWHTRPALPNKAIFVHDARFTPESAAQKLQRVRQAMREHGAGSHLISSLDDIAWLTNLRGSDVDFNPVFLAHLLIDEHTATLFVDTKKVDDTVQAALNAAGITIAQYEQIADAVSQCAGSLLIEAGKVALSTLAKLPDAVTLIEAVNPSTFFKACKSEAEMANIRAAMVQDGIALCGFFAELEHKLQQGDAVNERDIDLMLYHHRSQREHFVSASFDTIAGFNGNGAMPHYRAPDEGSSPIVGQGLLLIDSGGQYLTGTTDITRVTPIGEPTAAQKRDFTLVLKAHIALATTVFPEGILSPVLDAICRKPMWQAQCDYGHGTGHGVGYFLNVHEGPQRIALVQPAPHHAMRVGMLTSNEPGLYRPQQWGIRIENLVLNQRVAQPEENAFGEFLYFETVTLCPIDTRLVEVSLLTAEERSWLNDYHAEVRAKLLPHVTDAAQTWLLQRTEAI